MKRKVLIISGPTSTGKTGLAVDILKKFKGQLVSGDSCQVYKGMDIGTGKDQPSDIKLELIDLIEPNNPINVAMYSRLAKKVIKKIHQEGKLPIIVGCSGFYIDSIVNPNYDTFSVKPNKILRFFLNKLSISSLKKIYKFLDKKKYSKLNNSDVNNKYRLIRKIEIKVSGVSSKTKKKNIYDVLHISLTAPLPYIYERIDKRVTDRMDMGFEKEIRNLLKKYKWSDPGLQIAAYKCLKPYFDSPIQEVLKNCLQKWKYEEHSDARRQMAAIKSKAKELLIFDITKPNYKQKIFKVVSKWYNQL